MARQTVRRILGPGITAVIAIAILAGCGLTGGGWMASSLTEGAKANFAINVDGPGDGPARVNGTYHDKGSDATFPNGVRFRLTGFADAGFDDEGGCALFFATYVSQDQRNAPGEGDVQINACDFGEPGAGAGDTLSVEVLSGPYAGYTNSGTVGGGNFQAHE